MASQNKPTQDLSMSMYVSEWRARFVGKVSRGDRSEPMETGGKRLEYSYRKTDFKVTAWRVLRSWPKALYSTVQYCTKRAPQQQQKRAMGVIIGLDWLGLDWIGNRVSRGAFGGEGSVFGVSLWKSWPAPEPIRTGIVYRASHLFVCTRTLYCSDIRHTVVGWPWVI